MMDRLDVQVNESSQSKLIDKIIDLQSPKTDQQPETIDQKAFRIPVSELLKRVSSIKEGSFINIKNQRIPINDSMFCRLSPSIPKNTMVFIDGGNSLLIHSPNFVINFIRVYAVFYKDNRRIKQLKKECFSLTTTVVREGKTYFVSECFPDLFKFDEFSSTDPTLAPKNYVDIQTIGSALRSTAELLFTQEIIPLLKPGDMIIKDGDLDDRYTGQSEVMESLLGSLKKNSISLAALAKTTHVLTDTGSSAIGDLSKKAPFKPWAYIPKKFREKIDCTGSVDDSETSYIIPLHCFANLHGSSGYSFRIDIACGDPLTAINALAANAVDPSFLGYPYGLIDADLFARVSNDESERLKLILLSHGENKLSDAMKIVDAHTVLDKMRY